MSQPLTAPPPGRPPASRQPGPLPRPAAGFTLAELLWVVMIVLALAAIATPTYTDYLIRARVSEGFTLATEVQRTVADYRNRTGRWPASNQALGLPPAASLGGQFVAGIAVVDGVLHLEYRSGAFTEPPTRPPVLSLQPMVPAGYGGGPVSWRCGNSPVPDPMIAHGEPATTLEARHLPGACR